MGKTGKWLKGFLTGKKEKENDKCSNNQNPAAADSENPATPIVTLPTTPKEKRRWSFRRSSAAAKDANFSEQATTNHPPQVQAILDGKDDQTKHAMAVAVAVDATVAAAQAAAAVIRLTAAVTGRNSATQEEQAAAATKIQSAYRAYLAKQALSALRGIVKLQALVRGHLVRKHASATLRCLQALVTVQARARAQRIRMSEEAKPDNHRQSTHRRSTQDQRLRQQQYHQVNEIEENIKIVEMDMGETKGRTSVEHRFSTHRDRTSSRQETYQVSPTPSAITDMSPRTCSGYFEDYGLTAAQSSLQHCYSTVSQCDISRVSSPFPQPEYAESVMSYDYPLYPSYMANTQSSRAKARSQSAPKARPDSYERQPIKRRPSIEGRKVPRAVRMQRSSSHVGATAHSYQYPCSLKLDRSTVSLVGSECGSTSTMLTNSNYCRSLATYDQIGNKY